MISFLGFWDIVLLIAVSVQATALAYAPNPRIKAIIQTLPIPFTFASLAVGLPIEVTHVMGLIALLLYTTSVRWLHDQIGWPIILCIVVSVGVYLCAGWAGEEFVPKNSVSFWTVAVINLLLGGWLHFRREHFVDAHYASPLPIGVKLPIIMFVILGLLTMKIYLGGFVATFPMVGIIAAYETRQSLRTTWQSIPLTMVLVTPMMMTCRIAGQSLGLGGSLMVGWGVFLLFGWPILKAYLDSEVEPAEGLPLIRWVGHIK
jgi:hypothetical protein